MPGPCPDRQHQRHDHHPSTATAPRQPPRTARSLNPTLHPPSAAPRLARWQRAALIGLPALLALPLLLALALTVAGANWARSPIAHLVQHHTGRALQIEGDLRLGLGWPLLRVQVQGLRFANPAWAQEAQMLEVDHADLQLDLRALLRGRLLLPTVAVGRPVVMLETAADGRKSWLLDRAQSDASTAVQIGRLTLAQGRIGFDDPRRKTSLRLAIDTAGQQRDTPRPGPASALGAASDVLFTATGQWRGQPVQAGGRGASVLGLLEETQPYPLMMEGTVGPTRLRADGRVTGLARWSAVDMQVALQGGSLAQLFTLLGVGLPETGAYATAGRLLRDGRTWHYRGFSGKVGRSDVAGNLSVVLGGARPLLRGDIRSRLLDLADLAPMIGLRLAADGRTAAESATPPDTAATTRATPAPASAPRRVLPDVPFKTDRWRVFDADLQLSVQHVLRAPAVPLDSASARLQLQDAVLTLDALDIGTAGGHITGSVVLDARLAEVQASAKLQARGLQLVQLLAVSDNVRNSIGRIHGRVDLRGQGNSVGRMLGTADGALLLAIDPGRISRLLMEQMGLHLLEILQLNLTGDQPVALRCAVADFTVKDGVMTARHLALDTAVSSVTGSGQINLKQETLDLTLVPRTRNTSLVALRGPIRLHGPLGAPQVQLDTAGILARGAGAIALGLVNPLLALLPLVETGKNLPSTCAEVVADAGLNAPAVAGVAAQAAAAAGAAASAPGPRATSTAPQTGTRAGTAPPAPPPSRP
jgi:uncharacterized protein involved in outer membrane biogenesis